ncbi:MAG: Gfo/Idh/MocA family oxidoreductase, partial [Bauldia sp.]|nr:Gfo/Idh/MocA family oxidoreductase [Bauldia sp.]
GIIGCGNISTAYLTLAKLYPGLKVVACADVLPEAARARAEAHGIRAESVESILGDDAIEVIVNLTVPAAHYEISVAGLEAGKHVYSEKPLALTYKEAKSLVDLADARGLALGGATDTFLGGAAQTARRLIDDGAIGRVIAGTCQFINHGMEEWHPSPTFFYRPGGGPVFDMGPYYISSLINLIGPVKGVTAIASKGFEERVIGSGPQAGQPIPVLTPTTVNAIIEFHSGAQVTYAASWDVWRNGHDNPIELYGVDGTMLVPDPNYFGGVVAFSERDGEYAEVDASDQPFAAINWPVDNPTLGNYRMLGVADMVDAHARGRMPRCSGRMAAHIVEVMESILTAAAEGRYVTITSQIDRPAPMTAEDAARLTGSGA